MPIISGHHHISMLIKDAKANNYFYKTVLGLRRVKKTVNQDSPFMYHLFYGDLTGSAGTELSFFEMPMLAQTVRGTNAITRIGLLVPSYDSLLYWNERFEKLGVQHGEITKFAERDAILFEDHEGLRLALINNNGEEVPEKWQQWDDSSVQREHRILGMGPVEITVRSLEKLSSMLQEVFGYTEQTRQEQFAVLHAVAGQAFGEIVIVQQDGQSERPGKGSVHHLAISVKNADELRFWDQQVRQRGYESSGIVDRFYFQSLYFRESNGILFELATDGPGFTIDSTIEEMGHDLDLPPFLEKRRAEIEARLAPIE